MDQIQDLLIRRAPREIASHIFVQCISTDPCPSLKSIICQPLVLGAVCQSWRDIAWTTPQLWTTIAIIISGHPPDPSSRLQLLDQWITRSGHVPLDISLRTARDLQPSIVEPSVFPLIDLLNQYSSRWRSLHLSVLASLSNRFIGDGETISILKNLTLILRTWPFPRPGDSTTARFSLGTVSPHPQFVKLVNASPRSVDIKWDNLTQLDASLRVDELLEIFHHAHQLVSCTVRDCFEASTTENHFLETPVLLGCLQHI
jgi:hypothetical protein